MDRRHAFLGILAFSAAALAAPWPRATEPAARPLPDSEAAARGRTTADRGDPDRYEVAIRPRPGPPRLVLGETPDGRSITAACSTCHGSRPPNPENRATEDLDEFHQGLVVRHGDRACLACHNPDDYDTLRLAEGRALPFEESMQLCRQCHGPQARDYDHGAHGGMTGYWDLSRGPRVRNHCIDCHDPHAPAFPPMLPTFKPKDRFLPPETEHAPGGAHE